jgi:UTP--glucose-1-phosphate uridylyltransferase
MRGEPPVLAQMAEVQARTGRSVVAVEPVPIAEIGSYGVVAAVDPGEGGSAPITDIVEKPRPRSAVQPRRGGPLHPAPRRDAGAGHPGARARGRDPAHRRHPQADRLGRPGLGRRRLPLPRPALRLRLQDGVLEATMDLGLEHPEFGPQLRAHLERALGRSR